MELARLSLPLEQFLFPSEILWNLPTLVTMRDPTVERSSGMEHKLVTSLGTKEKPAKGFPSSLT